MGRMPLQQQATHVHTQVVACVQTTKKQLHSCASDRPTVLDCHVQVPTTGLKAHTKSSQAPRLCFVRLSKYFVVVNSRRIQNVIFCMTHTHITGCCCTAGVLQLLCSCTAVPDSLCCPGGSCRPVHSAAALHMAHSAVQHPAAGK